MIKIFTSSSQLPPESIQALPNTQFSISNRIFLVFMAACGVFFTSMAHSQEHIGETVQLKSVNYIDRYVRHRNYLGELTPVSSDADKNDSSFIKRPGLAGTGISFESVNYPGYFLRHQNFEIKLHKREESDLYKKDSTFTEEVGKAGKGKSFESVNFPGHYLRHCSFRMFIDNNKRGNTACDPAENVFKADVSFEVVSETGSP